MVAEAQDLQQPGWLVGATEGDSLVLRAGGVWVVAKIAALDRLVAEFDDSVSSSSVQIDLSEVSQLDTSGAMLFYRVAKAFESQGTKVAYTGVSESHQPLLQLVEAAEREPHDVELPPENTFVLMVERVGKSVFEALAEGTALLNFFGMTIVKLLQAFKNPRRLRFVSLVYQIEQTGLNAVPIVALLSFLIGLVLAYQGADQLLQFGAEIFTVNLLAVSVLREIGVLLTAIMVAGRSGSAFTAQIGTMKVNEEVDAMQTLGLDPIEVLVLPRVNALLITLPLLAFIADLSGLLGGAVMSLSSLDLNIVQFMRQLEEAVSLKNFLVGMVKAPVFAFLIAMVGCYEGLRVSGSAESVGRMTTKSVVEAIFLVIVADAVFSIVFAVLGI
jgi:phospholipid/cholesterol/gamma-HCH transport system permease protein